MSNYELLFEIWESGEMSPIRMSQFLADEVFVAWLSRHGRLGSELRSLIPTPVVCTTPAYGATPSLQEG